MSMALVAASDFSALTSADRIAVCPAILGGGGYNRRAGHRTNGEDETTFVEATSASSSARVLTNMKELHRPRSGRSTSSANSRSDSQLVQPTSAAEGSRRRSCFATSRCATFLSWLIRSARKTSSRRSCVTTRTVHCRIGDGVRVRRRSESRAMATTTSPSWSFNGIAPRHACSLERSRNASNAVRQS